MRKEKWQKPAKMLSDHRNFEKIGAAECSAVVSGWKLDNRCFYTCAVKYGQKSAGSCETAKI